MHGPGVVRNGSEPPCGINVHSLALVVDKIEDPLFLESVSPPESNNAVFCDPKKIYFRILGLRFALEHVLAGEEVTKRRRTYRSMRGVFLFISSALSYNFLPISGELHVSKKAFKRSASVGGKAVV